MLTRRAKAYNSSGSVV